MQGAAGSVLQLARSLIKQSESEPGSGQQNLANRLADSIFKALPHTYFLPVCLDGLSSEQLQPLRGSPVQSSVSSPPVLRLPKQPAASSGGWALW